MYLLSEPEPEEGEVESVAARPGGLPALAASTGFSPATLRRLYRGYKTECPAGILTEETFKQVTSLSTPYMQSLAQVFAKFFPSDAGDCALYAHHVFSCLDTRQTGAVTFEQLAAALAVLSHGGEAERLTWLFRLYDINGDGRVCREDMEVGMKVDFKILVNRFQLYMCRCGQDFAVSVYSITGDRDSQAGRQALLVWVATIAQVGSLTCSH